MYAGNLQVLLMTTRQGVRKVVRKVGLFGDFAVNKRNGP
jgi:hypothetical protein